MSEKRPFVRPEAHFIALPDDMNQRPEELSDAQLAELLSSSAVKEARKLYQIKQGYCTRDICGESLVIPVGGGAIAERKMAIVSPVGKFLWDKLQTRQTFGDLLLSVVREYEVSREEASADIREFLSELKTYKYLIEEKEYA